MGNTKNTIELNGKHYDAVNGHLLKPSEITSHDHLGAAQADAPSNSIDSPRPQPATPVHSPATGLKVHHKIERSHTLMRHVVNKPRPHAAKEKPEIHTTASPHVSHTFIDTKRTKRANKSRKSPQISRFSFQSEIIKKYSPLLEVKQPPLDELLIPGHRESTVQPPSLINPFETAMKSATSHANPKLKKRTLHTRAAKRLNVSPKKLNIGASLLAVLLLGGFIAYQNTPNLSMRVAAARAGVNGGLPGYQPAGFSLHGPIQATKGQVVLTYHSRSDQRQFSVNQRNSQWSNETLVENYVALNNRPYQTYENENKTIYIYDNSNATWLDNGVWYRVEGQSSLSSDQLIRLASSL